MIPFPDRKYMVILADPPWTYNNRKTGGSMKSAACDKYPTMSLDDIKMMPIADIAEKDCVLFLWATTPLLPEAFEVMTAWGFRYKTTVFWKKLSLGMGYWFRGQVELLLLGIKGKIKAFRCQKPNFIQSKLRSHSEKPEESYQLIEEVIQQKSRIELFARKRRHGWDVWGNEVTDGERLQAGKPQPNGDPILF